MLMPIGGQQHRLIWTHLVSDRPTTIAWLICYQHAMTPRWPGRCACIVPGLVDVALRNLVHFTHYSSCKRIPQANFLLETCFLTAPFGSIKFHFIPMYPNTFQDWLLTTALHRLRFPQFHSHHSSLHLDYCFPLPRFRRRFCFAIAATSVYLPQSLCWLTLLRIFTVLNQHWMTCLCTNTNTHKTRRARSTTITPKSALNQHRYLH